MDAGVDSGVDAGVDAGPPTELTTSCDDDAGMAPATGDAKCDLCQDVACSILCGAWFECNSVDAMGGCVDFRSRGFILRGDGTFSQLRGQAWDAGPLILCEEPTAGSWSATGEGSIDCSKLSSNAVAGTINLGDETAQLCLFECDTHLVFPGAPRSVRVPAVDIPECQ